MKFKNPLVWIDLEMSGLDLKKDKILEIAVILTSGCLKERVAGPNLIIHQPIELMNSMDEWCKTHHGRSGLTDQVEKSNVNMKEAQQLVLDFVKKYIPDKGIGVLAGNSVHVDRQFLQDQMPEIIEHLHYRIVDVSTIKEISKRWFPSVRTYKKMTNHRALDDINESIQELLYFRDNVFKQVEI